MLEVEGVTTDGINEEGLWRQTLTLPIHVFPPSSCANILSNPPICYSGDMDNLDSKCDVIKPNISDREIALLGLKNVLYLVDAVLKIELWFTR